MTPMVFILVLVGVSCVTELLMRFIVWLDGNGGASHRRGRYDEGRGQILH